MAASLLPLPRAVFYNAATGEALAGGFVYTYVPGGTTSKTTWRDAGGTTANSNPIVLDASGSALVYGSGSYQITVTDSLGNQIPGYSGLSQDPFSVTGISAAMQPVVAAATTSDATGLLTYLDAGASASPVSLNIPLGQFVLPAFFGAVGDGVTDDTTAIRAALGVAITTGRELRLQGKIGTNFAITSQIDLGAVGLRVSGGNTTRAKFTASGNFGAIFNFTATAADINFDYVGFDQTGTNTRCFSMAHGAQVCKFSYCLFKGDGTLDLVYSQASGYIEYWDCTWDCDGAGTIGIKLDGYNQNTVFMGGHAGGVGQAMIIQNSTGNIANNVQGTKCTSFTSICTGPIAIQLGGDAFSTQFTGCIIDQAGFAAILIGSGATLTQIIGGYWGLIGGSAGVPIQIAASSGAGTTIGSVTTFGGTNAISVQASSTARVGSVTLTGNTFVGAITTTLSLDSVDDCIITSNFDLSTPTDGSWATVRTNAAGGAYTFGDNAWYTTSPGVFDAASSYHCRPDRGITLSNKGTAVSASGTSVTFAHGITSVQPNSIQVTQLSGTGMNFNVSTVSGGDITISYGTAGAATFMWTAEYYT